MNQNDKPVNTPQIQRPSLSSCESDREYYERIAQMAKDRGYERLLRMCERFIREDADEDAGRWGSTRLTGSLEFREKHKHVLRPF